MDKINLKYPASKIDELLIKIDSQNFNNYLLNTGGILKGRYYLGLNAEISNNSGGRILGHDGLSTTIIGNAGGILNLEAVGLNVRVSNGLSSYRVLTEADKGINIVPLDSYGKISSQYLPSSVDDIVEVTSTNDLKTITGERGKIYVTLDTNITYRWSGTQFVEISKSLGLGTNENEAYPGNLGAANATSINNLTATVGTHSSDINTLKSTVGSHTNSLSSITSTLQSVNQSIINQGTTIGGHTQQIANLDSNKLSKTEKASDSAKADSATNASQLEGMSILHGWTGVNSGVPFVGSDGVMEFGRMIDFHIASEPSGTDYATRLRCQETVTGVDVYLPSTSGTLALTTGNVASATNATNASQLGGVAASGYARLSGARFTGDSAVQGVFRVNTAADNRNCLAILAEIATGVNQGMAHIGTNYGFSNMDGSFTQNIIYAMSVYRGMVGIGRSFTYSELNTAYKNNRPLTVDGNAVITGTMTATASYHDINYTTSDERLKDFEGDVEVDLEKLKTLPKKYFKWKEYSERGRTLGTSAQALQKIYPELVDTRTDGMLSVNYEGLSVVALAAIDKLAEKNDKLAEQNTELSKKNAELERRVAKIEKLLNIES